MADLVIAEYEEIANVADAIRSKAGITDTMTLSEMATNVSNIIGEGVMLDTALSETSNNPVQNKVITAEIKQLKANAIKRTYSGETIVATDSSGVHLEGLRVLGRSEQVSTTGKNLFDYYTYKENKSYSFYVEPGKTLYRNSRLMVNSDWKVYDSTDNLICTFQDVGFRESNPFILPDNARYIYTNDAGIESDMYVGYDSDTTYEPYTGGKASPSTDYPQPIESVGDDGSIDVGVYGKNFLKNKETSATSGGVTFTVNDDKSVTVKGTATENVSFYLIGDAHAVREPISAGTYLLSGSNGGMLEYSLIIGVTGVGEYQQNDGIDKEIVIESDNTFYVRIRVMSGVTVNTTIYPMLRLASVEDSTYEPYKAKQSLPISTPNGLPAIQVTDAYLATYTDENGVMWCADEIVCGEKKIQRVNDIVFDGTEGGWSLYESATYTGFKITISSMKPNMRTNGLCSHFKPQSSPANSSNDGVTFGASNSVIYFTFSEERFSTVDDWKAYLAEQYANGTPVTVKYILAEPIEEPLSTSEIEAYKALTSNYPTTTILNDENAHMEAVLVTDTKNHIEQNYVPKSEFLSVVDRVSALEQKALA